MAAKEKAKLREFEERKYNELRRYIIEDKGLPNLIEEIKNIIKSAGKYDSHFNDFLSGTKIDDEAKGL